MCEKRARKTKKGSQVSLLREARRIQRIQRMTPSPAIDDPSHGQLPQYVFIDKATQNKVILELAWKTVALMHKNKLIQQKIIALQKETSEFVASIVNNPEHKKRYMDYLQSQGQYGLPIPQDYSSSPQSSGSDSPCSSSYFPSSPEPSSPPMSPKSEPEPEPQTVPGDEDVEQIKTESDI